MQKRHVLVECIHGYYDSFSFYNSVHNSFYCQDIFIVFDTLFGTDCVYYHDMEFQRLQSVQCVTLAPMTAVVA